MQRDSLATRPHRFVCTRLNAHPLPDSGGDETGSMFAQNS
jgi:hypothetical protein